MKDVDDLAQFIRRVDGNHTMGAGALAEAIVAYQVEAMLADDVIERAARRIYRHQVPAHLACVMTQWEEAHETQRDHFLSVARAALTAALGIEGDE